MLTQLLDKLIRTSAGRTRFILAVVGLSVALLLILAAVQLQANYNQLLYGKTNQDSVANFLVINKEVTEKTAGATNLYPRQIDDLRQQPFVDAVGILTPCHFKVEAEFLSDRIPIHSDIFFESVPDAFIDVQSKDWKWDSTSNFIPLIIPHMFLDMFNFGFAMSQDLPQLTEEFVRNLPLQIRIRSAYGPQVFYGKVVGFSDRISSVLVPQAFMEWANKQFGTVQQDEPSRVVIRTKDPGNPELIRYLHDHGLTTDTEKTRFSKYREIVNAVVNISWVTGATMLLFALLIFTLFIQLTVASAKEEITLLVTLGASPAQLHRFLMKKFFPPNILICVAVLVILSGLQYWLRDFLSAQQIFIDPYISYATLMTAVVILLVLWFVHNRTIRKYVRFD